MDHDSEPGPDSQPFAVSWPSVPDDAAGQSQPSPPPPPRARSTWLKRLGVGTAAVGLAGGTFAVVWAATSGGSSGTSAPAAASQAASGGDQGFSAADPSQSAPGPGSGGPGGFGFAFRGPFGGPGPDGRAGHQRTPAMAGTVKNISGSTITIQDFVGFTRTIHTSSSTTYTRGGQSANSSAVTKGSNILATGTVDKNGTDLDASKVAVQLPRVAGTVQSVSGQSFVVQGRDGTTHKVTTTSSTTFRNGRSQGSLSDVKQGSRVIATGDQQSNGDLTATAVQILPARPQGAPNAPMPPGPPGGGTQSGNTT